MRDEIGFVLGEDVPVLPRLLRRRGFKTAGVVSSYLLRKETGLGPAFAFFDDDQPPGDEAWSPVRDGAEALKVAEQWIDSIDTSRFFLFLHLPGPTGKADNDARVAAADELVGQLVAFLKKRGLYTGGVIVLTSGHGLGLGDHGEEGHGLFLYEPVVRVPLIVKLPQRDGGGRHSAALVQHIDVAPTMLDLVGAPRPSKLGGRSLRNVLDSPTATIPPRQVYAESFAPRFRFGWSEVQSLTDERHRYIKSPRPELYDVLQDPRERNDLSETETATLEPLRDALDKLPADIPVPQPAAPPDAERERLARMGYLAVDGIPPEAPIDVKDRSDVHNRYWRASSLAIAGKPADAIAAYREVVRADPTLAIAWDRLAALLLDAGRLKEAGAAITSLLRLYPDEARVAAAEARLQLLTAATPAVGRPRRARGKRLDGARREDQGGGHPQRRTQGGRGRCLCERPRRRFRSSSKLLDCTLCSLDLSEISAASSRGNPSVPAILLPSTAGLFCAILEAGRVSPRRPPWLLGNEAEVNTARRGHAHPHTDQSDVGRRVTGGALSGDRRQA